VARCKSDEVFSTFQASTTITTGFRYEAISAPDHLGPPFAALDPENGEVTAALLTRARDGNENSDVLVHMKAGLAEGHRPGSMVWRVMFPTPQYKPACMIGIKGGRVFRLGQSALAAAKNMARLWHMAVACQNKQNVFDDLSHWRISISERLRRKTVCYEGRSNVYC